jgi:hypothetical protein
MQLHACSKMVRLIRSGPKTQGAGSYVAGRSELLILWRNWWPGGVWGGTGAINGHI